MTKVRVGYSFSRDLFLQVLSVSYLKTGNVLLTEVNLDRWDQLSNQ
jgi:hypothetical protein